MKTPGELNPWSMQVSYRLGEHGWSQLDVWLDGYQAHKHLDYCITHIFNSPLLEIGDALLLLQIGAQEVKFDLHGEPGLDKWTISRIPDRQHLLLVHIDSYADNFEINDPPELGTFAFEVHREFFIDSFLAELDKIATLLKHPRFARDRSPDEFPWDEWRKLRQARPRSE